MSLYALKKQPFQQTRVRWGDFPLIPNLINYIKSRSRNQSASTNILDQLKFGVFNDLEELHGAFEDASVESVQEMKRITNLKKIGIWFGTSCTTINALLENLGSLELVEIGDLIYGGLWKLSENKNFVCPNIKSFGASLELDGKIRADQFTKMFPNLENFHVFRRFDSNESFAVLLSKLKKLKKLRLDDVKINADFILQCIRDCGKNLEEIEDEQRPFGWKKPNKIVPGFESFKIGRSTGCLVIMYTAYFLQFSP